MVLAIVIVFVSRSIWPLAKPTAPQDAPMSPQAKPKIIMHRTHATTPDPSGLYFAASTEGSFSILMPVPFNDFTVTSDEPNVGLVNIYSIGGSSTEGIKFSASEIPNVNGKRCVTNLVEFAKNLQISGQNVSDVQTSYVDGYPSVSYSAKDLSGGCYFLDVQKPGSFITLTLEYPLDQQAKAALFRPVFLSSLKNKWGGSSAKYMWSNSRSYP
jgi:hypothetical protein